MSNKSNRGDKGVNGTKSQDKREMITSHNGGPSVSKKGKGKHFKDESGGEAIRKIDPENTAKKHRTVFKSH